MRKLFVLTATAFLALGTAGVANAAVLNWAGTATALLADFAPAEFRGGGVATINGSSGAVPAHLSTLRLAASRGQIQGTDTVLVTDPDYTCSGWCPVLKYDGVRLMTGTWGGISGGAASTSTGGGILPVGGTVKICILLDGVHDILPDTADAAHHRERRARHRHQGRRRRRDDLRRAATGASRFSLQAAPWTIKTATVLDRITPTGAPPPILTTWVAKGWAHAPVSTTTSTAQPGGMVQLVTPNQIMTNMTAAPTTRWGRS